MIGSVVADCRHGVRQLRKDLGFTLAAVLILALGIGADNAAFSILDPLLLRKLPVRSPDELIWVRSTGTLGPAEISHVETFRIYRDKASAFSCVLAFSRMAPYEVKHHGRTIDATGELVSGNYFTALGLRRFLGRLFSNADEQGSAVVVSFDFWRKSLNSDPKAIGEALVLGGQADASRTGSAALRSYTIIGIAPAGFFGAEVGESPSLYMPLGATDSPSQDYWQTQGVTILARLKPNAFVPQAQASLDPLLQAVGKASAIPEVEREEFFAHVLLTPAARGISPARAKFSLPTRVLMTVVGILLLIACGNVANLLLVRGVTRKREISIRIALGAGRWRVVRQLLTESTLLAATGAAAGLAVGQWTSQLLAASLSTPQFPVVLATELNGRLLLFTGGALTLTLLVCGLAPALSTTTGELSELKTKGDASHGSLLQSRLRQSLIVGQATLSMTLLASAGLLLRSLFNLEAYDAGFDRDNVSTVTINGYSAIRTRDQVAAFYGRLLERVKEIPGVHSASYSSFTPVSGRQVGINIAVEGYTPRPGEMVNEQFVGISPGYFETMGIHLLQGRDFRQDDVRPHSRSYLAPTVAIINRTMSRRFFGDSSPIGKHLRFVNSTRPPLEIIGVVATSTYNDLREPPTDFFYVPGTHGDVEIRGNLPMKALAGSLQHVLQSMGNGVKITSVKTLREAVDESLHSDRLIAALCGVVSILALVLTCAGLYGALAFDVARRSSEIGIRIALGAGRRDILLLVVGQGMRLTFSGLVLAVPSTLVAGSMLASLLFGVGQIDPLTFGGISLIFLAASAFACYLPARRAVQVAPIIVMRCE